jgi:hypothetical protein
VQYGKERKNSTAPKPEIQFSPGTNLTGYIPAAHPTARLPFGPFIDPAVKERIQRQRKSVGGQLTSQRKRIERDVHMAFARKLIQEHPTMKTDELAKLIGADCIRRNPAHVKCTHRTISDHVRAAKLPKR